MRGKTHIEVELGSQIRRDFALTLIYATQPRLIFSLINVPHHVPFKTFRRKAILFAPGIRESEREPIFERKKKKCRRQKSKLSIFEPEAKIKLDSGESEKRTNKVSGRIGKTVVLYVNSEFPTLSVFSCGWTKTGSS